jgi:hypothetical protein
MCGIFIGMNPPPNAAIRMKSTIITIRVSQEQHEQLSKLAEENHQTMSNLVAGFCESCYELISEDEPKLPKFLSMCRAAHHYDKERKTAL